MEISENRLQQLLQDAATQGANAALATALKGNRFKELKKANVRLVQIRRTRLIAALFRNLGINPKDLNVSQVLRQAVDLGLEEFTFVEHTPGEIGKHPRVSFMIDLQSLEKTKLAGENFTDTVILGLILMAMRKTAQESGVAQST